MGEYAHIVEILPMLLMHYPKDESRDGILRKDWMAMGLAYKITTSALWS